MNMPESMGLRANLYGPVVISFGGGLTGTGVPLSLMNKAVEKSIRNIPRYNNKTNPMGNAK